MLEMYLNLPKLCTDNWQPYRFFFVVYHSIGEIKMIIFRHWVYRLDGYITDVATAYTKAVHSVCTWNGCQRLAFNLLTKCVCAPPENVSCEIYKFRCADGTLCIADEKVCDHDINCPDESDEVDCGKLLLLLLIYFYRLPTQSLFTKPIGLKIEVKQCKMVVVVVDVVAAAGGPKFGVNLGVVKMILT